MPFVLRQQMLSGGKYVLPLASFDVWDILTLAWLGNGTSQNTLVVDVSRNLFSTENE